MVFDVSVLWVLGAAVVYFAVGAAWYSPLMFAKPWMAALGKKPGEQAMPAAPMVITFLSILLLVMVEAYLIQATKTPGLWRGMFLGAKLWLGFVATTSLINNVFQSNNKKLWLIDQGYHLVGLVLAGGILAYFAS